MNNIVTLCDDRSYQSILKIAAGEETILQRMAELNLAKSYMHSRFPPLVWMQLRANRFRRGLNAGSLAGITSLIPTTTSI